MSQTLTAERLKNLAVWVVSAFVKGKPLEDAIAECATTNHLEGEQIKRLIEASNQIAYLKLMESATDRTFEFPVAEYESVIRKMVTPSEVRTLEKAAGQVSEVVDPFLQKPGLEKKASASTSEVEITGSGFTSLLLRSIGEAKSEIEKIASDRSYNNVEFRTLTKAIEKDPLVMEKAAFFKLEDETQSVLSAITDHEIVKEASVMFRKEDSTPLLKLQNLIKKAHEMAERTQHLTELISLGEAEIMKSASEQVQKSKQGIVGRAIDKVLPKVNPNRTPIIPKMIGKGVSAGTSVALSPVMTHAMVGGTMTHTRDVWKTLQGGNQYA